MSKGRILQTGFTGQQGGAGNRFKYTAVAKLFGDALRHYGYEVDHRMAEINEDLSVYDAVFSGLGPANGLGSRFTYGALDAIGRANDSGAALVFYIDDWQTQLIRPSMRTMVRDPNRLAKPFLGDARNKAQYAWVNESTANRDRLIAVCDIIGNGTWPTTVMALYDGGNWDLFRDRLDVQSLVGVDGTPFYPDYDTKIPNDDDRSFEWVFGIVSDQRKWIDSLDLTWPLAHRGGIASKAAEGLPEPKLVQQYADSWGVLSCPYWHAGSGWLRIRHHHAAQTKSILVTESPELSFISDVYDITASEVEEMTMRELRARANAQHEAWFTRLPSKDEVATRIGEMMDKEIGAMK